MGSKIGDLEYQSLVAKIFQQDLIDGKIDRSSVEPLINAFLEARQLSDSETALWADLQNKIRSGGTPEQIRVLDDLISSYEIYKSLIGPQENQAAVSHPLLAPRLEEYETAMLNFVVSDFRGLGMTASRRVKISPQTAITGKEDTLNVVFSNEFFTGLVHDDRFFMIINPDAETFGMDPAHDRPNAANFFPNREIPAYFHGFPGGESSSGKTGQSETLTGLWGSLVFLRSTLEDLGFAEDKAVFHKNILVGPELKRLLPEQIAGAENLKGFSIELYEEDTWVHLIPDVDRPFSINDIPFNPLLSPELADKVLDHILTIAETLKFLGISLTPSSWLNLGFDVATGNASFDVAAIPTLLDSTLFSQAIKSPDGPVRVKTDFYFPNLAAFSTGDRDAMSSEKVLMQIITQLLRLSGRRPPDLDMLTGLALDEFQRYLAFNSFDSHIDTGKGGKKQISNIIKYYLITLDLRGIMEFMTLVLFPLLKEKDPVLLLHTSKVFIDEAAKEADRGGSVADFWINNSNDLWNIVEFPVRKKGGGGHSSGSESGWNGCGGNGMLNGGNPIGQAKADTVIMPPNNILTGGAGLYLPLALSTNLMPANFTVPVVL
jgi:hypothetical protein